MEALVFVLGMFTGIVLTLLIDVFILWFWTKDGPLEINRRRKVLDEG